jgi:hypothetical protein
VISTVKFENVTSASSGFDMQTSSQNVSADILRVSFEVATRCESSTVHCGFPALLKSLRPARLPESLPVLLACLPLGIAAERVAWQADLCLPRDAERHRKLEFREVLFAIRDRRQVLRVMSIP